MSDKGENMKVKWQEEIVGVGRMWEKTGIEVSLEWNIHSVCRKKLDGLNAVGSMQWKILTTRLRSWTR